MKTDPNIGDLFAVVDARMAAAKTKADKLRALATLTMEVCAREDLSERAQLNQLAYLSGMAAGHLHAYAGLIERGVA